MMATTQWVTTDLVEMACGQCGIPFAVPRIFDDENKDTGRSWYCPNGHCRAYNESTVVKLEREVQRQRALADQLQAFGSEQFERVQAVERRLKSTRGVVTRLKNRVARGLCPCCHKKFAELHVHMKEVHPGYGEAT